MDDQHPHSRRRKSCYSLESRGKEYRRVASEAGREMRRLKGSATPAYARQLHQIRKHVTNAVGALDRATAACSALGANSISETLRKARFRVLEAFGAYQSEVSNGNVEQADKILRAPLQDGFRLLREALQVACP